MTTPDIWAKVKQQGEQKLYTLQTRDFATAQAMRVAPQLLEALQNLMGVSDEKHPRWLEASNAITLATKE